MSKNGEGVRQTDVGHSYTGYVSLERSVGRTDEKTRRRRQWTSGECKNLIKSTMLHKTRGCKKLPGLKKETYKILCKYMYKYILEFM